MQLIESEVDAPPELVSEVLTEFPTYRELPYRRSSADRHEGGDVVLDIERVPATTADPWRGPAGIDGGEQESDSDHEQRSEEYLKRCELPGPFDLLKRFTQRERREDESRSFNL